MSELYSFLCAHQGTSREEKQF